MKWRIPYFDLVLGDEERQAVISVIRSNWLTTGPKIDEFEQQFAASLGGQVHALAVANCTVALHLALEALGVTAGDEVVCPSLTFVATANAVRYTGAIPVFADIRSESEWNLDPADLTRKITKKTKAIMVVHYAGYPCRMEEIEEIAGEYNLAVVEDCSHGPLAEWRGRKLGTIGDIGCFSFFSNKNMTTGEGGMVVTRNGDIAEKIRIMRSHGMTSSSYDRYRGHAFNYDVTMLGYNYRMDEIRASIGIAQLNKLPNANKRRRSLVDYYRTALRERVEAIKIPFAEWNGDYGYHIFPVLLPDGYGKREGLMAALADDGIQTSIHYRPVHSFTAYKGFNAALPRTDAIAPRILSLPLYPTLTKADIDYVTDRIASHLK